MDPKTHELFAQVLLDTVCETDTSSKIWGNAPDVDITFLHRWYRHRINVLPDIYKDSLKNCKSETIDKDAIALCIISHMYIDIFNGWIFPFGVFYPIYPEDTILNDVLDDLDNPKLLVQDLKKLSGSVAFSDMFYAESKGIMQEFVNNINVKYVPSVIDVIVNRLATHTGKNCDDIYKKAMKNIAAFTRNDIYNNIVKTQVVDACEQFEIEYADLINKVTSC